MLEGGNESEDRVSINCLRSFHVQGDEVAVDLQPAAEAQPANQGRWANLSEVANPCLISTGGRILAPGLQQQAQGEVVVAEFLQATGESSFF